MNELFSKEVIAGVLLIIRLIGSAYLVKVIKVQLKLLRVPAVDERGNVDEGTMKFRQTLTRMTFVILLGQVIPILIDILAMVNGSVPAWLGIVYAISNAFTALTAAVLIWRLYEMATETKAANDEQKLHTQERHEQELADKI
jgi:hypothetical protein